MEIEDLSKLLPILVLGALFFVTAVGAFYWAARHGHFRNFESQSRTIFTEEEPEGEISDGFPGENKR